MTIQANGIGTKLRHGKADPENLLKTCANNLFPRLGGKKLSKMCEKVIEFSLKTHFLIYCILNIYPPPPPTLLRCTCTIYSILHSKLC